MIKGWVAAGDLVAFLLYVTTLIATIRRIIEFAEQFQRGMTGIERFLQIMDADPSKFSMRQTLWKWESRRAKSHSTM